MAGELSKYSTSSSVTSAISSALSSYDDSSQVDSKIITALLDFYTRADLDQEIADALGNVDLSNYYTVTTRRPKRRRCISLGPNSIPSSRPRSPSIGPAAERNPRSTTPSPASWTRPPRTPATSCVRRARRVGTSSTWSRSSSRPASCGTCSWKRPSRLRCDSWTKAEADARFLRTNDLGPLDARYFPNTPGAEGGGIFNLVLTQRTSVVIRNLLCQSPLSAQPILGNGSTLQISSDCWSKGQSDGRYPGCELQLRQHAFWQTCLLKS